MKKAAILAAPGFEEIELMAPLDILRRLNFDVLLAGVQSDKVVSTHDVTVTTDTMLDKLHADKLDALILPGRAQAPGCSATRRKSSTWSKRCMPRASWWPPSAPPPSLWRKPAW